MSPNHLTLHSRFFSFLFFFASSPIFPYVLHDKENATRVRLSSSMTIYVQTTIHCVALSNDDDDENSDFSKSSTMT